MKNLLLIIPIFFFSLVSTMTQAQLVITPNPVYVEEVDIEEFDVVAHSMIKNEVPVVKNLVWERSIIEMTEGWESAVCDKNACYLPFVDNQEFTLGPLEEDIIDVHIYPNGKEGFAIIEVTVSDKSDEENTATGVYYFNQTVSVNPERLSNKIKVYPNPVTDLLIIEDNTEVYSLELFDLNGKSSGFWVLNGSHTIDVRRLISGTYIARMSNKDGRQVSSNLIIKK